MKKTISVVLAALMLLSCLPFTVFAAEETWSQVQTVSDVWTVQAGDTVTVTGTYTFTNRLAVEENGKLVIAQGASVIVTGNGQLYNSGSITVETGGTLTITGLGESEKAALINYATGTIELKAGCSALLAKGSFGRNQGYIANIDRMSINGVLEHWIDLPQAVTDSYIKAETWNRQDMTVQFSTSYLPETSDLFEEDLSYMNSSLYTACPSGGWFRHGFKVYIRIDADNNGSWVDTSRMKLTVNGQLASSVATVDNDRGVFCITPLNSLKCEIYSTKYKDIVKLFTVELPRTEGYYVITKDGDVDIATVEYGKTFSFRVVLNPDYDKSNVEVYVNSFHLEPSDEHGYYDIVGPSDPQVGFPQYTVGGDVAANQGGVQENLYIQIMGVAPNERVNMMNDIVSFIKEIFDVIKSIFSYFADLFTGLGSGLGI